MDNNFQCDPVNIEQLARYDFLDLCILGETGTGKTRAARLLHDLSPRCNRPFVSVNCAELAPSIIESELFGHEKGAFTGASVAKEGKFEAAGGGTLFLDEIGELDTGLQAKLLKVVEEKAITRVGGNRPRRIDVRIIYATHRDLAVFREDLRYRITAHAIWLKPLRERVEEIVPLAQEFVNDFVAKSGATIAADRPVLQVLERAQWLGNVRELRSFIEKVCVEALFAADAAGEQNIRVRLTSEIITRTLQKVAIDRWSLPTSPVSPRQFTSGEKMEDYLEEIETDLVTNALATHNNNRTRAAKELGISRSGLLKKLKRMSANL